jgi:hypothetical protein
MCRSLWERVVVCSWAASEGVAAGVGVAEEAREEVDGGKMTGVAVPEPEAEAETEPVVEPGREGGWVRS